MMTDELILRINPTNGSITVEESSNGIFSHKQITADSLYDCNKSSLQREIVASGLLPQNCISFTAGSEDFRSITIMYTEDYADISYYNTVYEHFPLPRLLFKFNLNMGLRVQSCQVAVTKNERLTPDTPLYHYPFSNVSGYSLCVGNNPLPKCESLHTLSSLPYFILNLPNNDDQYKKTNNRQSLEFRDLMEKLKDKNPAYYYENVLIPNGHTVKDFIKN